MTLMPGIRQLHGEKPEEMPDADGCRVGVGEGHFFAVTDVIGRIFPVSS